MKKIILEAIRNNKLYEGSQIYKTIYFRVKSVADGTIIVASKKNSDRFTKYKYSNNRLKYIGYHCE